MLEAAKQATDRLWPWQDMVILSAGRLSDGARCLSLCISREALSILQDVFMYVH